MNTQETSPKDNPKRRNRWMLIAIVVFILLFFAYGLYWLLVLRDRVSTDDAYVAGIQAPVIAQTTGKVTQVNVINTDLVEAGDILIVLDNIDAKLAYQEALNILANTVRQTQVLYINAKKYADSIKSDQLTLRQAKQDYHRRLALGRHDDVSKEELQHSKHAMEQAQLQVEIAQQQYQSNQVLLHGVNLPDHPAVKKAADNVRQAWINLQRTSVRSPITGYVARSNVEVGSQVNPESQLMVIVPAEPTWVDANFKETQLKNIRIGQDVTATSDLYDDNVVYHGKVIGINMGTGSAFSLLPAQNATGNWIKVVQRLAVRIVLDPKQVHRFPLRIGLSMNVTIDTKNRKGAVLAPDVRSKPFYQSEAFVLDLKQINQKIEHVITQNTYSILKEQ